ncbi:CRISPR-associated protein Cas4 [Salinilacihabitans rarus]|uniref:CRISPR-associated protein Cas4 n=1 Tax=Salinilacihabitans rarus TaxID=2961596 RepID=UPI0020C85041|nr:CRISPR-associated protein Cas4 [Salinilacihabitans rarus]
MIGSGFRDELVHVSALQEFVYCSRRYYYHRYHDQIGSPFELVDGRSKHATQSRRGGWTTERYFRSEELGLHGKIDLVESDHGSLTPVERKRAESGDYYLSDEVQLAGYCMLLESAIDEQVNVGYIYLYSTDERHAIRISDNHRQTVEETVSRINSMTVSSIPPFTDNPSKCDGCSAREYCLPAETARMEHDKVRGTGWEDQQ